MKLVYGNYRLYPDSWWVFGSVLITGLYVYLDAIGWVIASFLFFLFALWAMNLRMGEVL